MQVFMTQLLHGNSGCVPLTSSLSTFHMLMAGNSAYLLLALVLCQQP